MEYKCYIRILLAIFISLNCYCVINETPRQSHQTQYVKHETNDESRTEILAYTIKYAEYIDALVSIDPDRRGPLQISVDYLNDVNRISGRKKFVLTDRYRWGKSYEMFYIYTDYYSDKYINAGMSLEEAKTRIHKGGPFGPENDETLGYWKRIESMLSN